MARGHVIDKLSPSITQGEDTRYQKGDSQGPSFASDAALDDLIRVEVDGQEISSEHYTVSEEENGIVITLKPDYVESLSEGEHTIGIVCESGTALAQLEVVGEAGAIAGDSEDPKTGDGKNLPLWISLLVVAVAALTGLLWWRRKKNGEDASF